MAAELEQSAGRAQGRGGIAAAAAFLRHAVALTEDPERRSARALAAAEAGLQAGAFDAALDLLATAEAGALDQSQRARVTFARGQVMFASGDSAGGSKLLFEAARRIEACDLERAREAYLTAWGAAFTGAHQQGGGGTLLEICQAVRALPGPSGAPRPRDLLLEGLARLTTDGRAAAVPTLQRAATALSKISAEDTLRFGLVASAPSTLVWDEASFFAVCERRVRFARDAGSLMQLPLFLENAAIARLWVGDLKGAASFIAESNSVAEATGSDHSPYALLWLRALQGSKSDATALIERALEQTAGAATHARHAAAVLNNGLSRYDEAASAARLAVANTFDLWYSTWSLPELVEAAVHCGDESLAREALEQTIETTGPCGTDFAHGIEARTRAVVDEGAPADALYREAIDRLSRTPLRPELARTHLLYGESLRRRRQRSSARAQLRTAHDMFSAIGMEAFAERARRELSATGEHARKRSVETRDDLTPKRSRSPGLHETGCPTPRSAPRCSSADTRSNGTCARSSRSSRSALGTSSRQPSPKREPAEQVDRPPVLEGAAAPVQRGRFLDSPGPQRRRQST